VVSVLPVPGGPYTVSVVGRYPFVNTATNVHQRLFLVVARHDPVGIGQRVERAFVGEHAVGRGHVVEQVVVVGHSGTMIGDLGSVERSRNVCDIIATYRLVDQERFVGGSPPRRSAHSDTHAEFSLLCGGRPPTVRRSHQRRSARGATAHS
jgi:hypothetical protein